MTSGYAPTPDVERVDDNDNFCACKHTNGITPSSCPMTGCCNVYYHDRLGSVACSSQGLQAASEPGGTLAASRGTISRQIDGRAYDVNVHNGLSESSALFAPPW